MLTRKQFFELAAAALGLTVLRGCGTSSIPSPPSAPTEPDAHDAIDARRSDARGPDATLPDGATTGRCIQNGTIVSIGTNHGHVLVVSKQDVVAGLPKLYHIRGTSSHDHTVACTAEMFAQLAQDHAIESSSSFDDDHAHMIAITCA
jgi:hypothetical protein